MNKKKTKKISFRIMAVMLAVMTGVTFMPVPGGIANAKENSAAKMQKKAERPHPAAEALQNAVSSSVKTGKKSGGSLDTAIGSEQKLGGSTDNNLLYVSAPNSSGIVSVTGSIPSDDIIYDKLYIDNLYTVVRDVGTKTMNFSVDMKNYPVGYHTMAVTYKSASTGESIYDESGKLVGTICTYIPTYIYGTPSNSVGRYDVYSKKMFYDNYNNMNRYDTDCNVYMQHRIKGKKKYGKWITDGYMNSSTNYTFPRLKPGKKFQTRLYYGKAFTYEGKDYFWTSRKSGVRKMTAGQKKLPVKSISVKAYNVKKRVHYTYYTTGYYYRRTYRVKTTYYTYKLKAVVKMKKKPKAKGIMINKYRVKGNKKVYVKKLGSFTSYSKPRKQKYWIYTTSYQDKKYGGWSPQKKKNCRVR